LFVPPWAGAHLEIAGVIRISGSVGVRVLVKAATSSGF
jgi:hypothetical protein